MRRLLRLAPLVAASFVAGVALPRATVWRHHHEDGEHAHVHVEGPSGHHHHHDDHDEHHHDDHHHDDETPAGAGLTASGPADHTHWQHPFLRVDREPAARLVRIDRIAWLPAFHAGEPLAPARPAPRSRGPPLG